MLRVHCYTNIKSNFKEVINGRCFLLTDEEDKLYIDVCNSEEAMEYLMIWTAAISTPFLTVSSLPDIGE